jgi:hypothetical protein
VHVVARRVGRGVQVEADEPLDEGRSDQVGPATDFQQETAPFSDSFPGCPR